MTKKNRLKLDFSLITNEERNQFITEYLTTEMFQQQPPTEEELSTMADYILWGVDPKTGKNGKQSGLSLKSKYGTWDDSPTESLDQLLEMPTFNEAQISALGATQFRAKKETFSREEALAQSTPLVRESFERLFQQIDQLELEIALYDLAHRRRTKPIRQQLLSLFTEEQLREEQEKISHWNQYHYLKKRHQLVELRREQYTLRDSYRKIIYSQNDFSYDETDIDFDVDIEVLPLGLLHDSALSYLVFQRTKEVLPNTLSEKELKQISNLYWQKKNFAPTASQMWVDFRDLEHVYQLLNYAGELRELVPEKDVSSNLAALLRTLYFYIEQADLSEVQREILDLKLQKKRNVDIADYINKKYNKTYTVNYISTIFRHRIIPRINSAAAMHEKVIENIYYPENFKCCSKCRTILLKCTDNFMKKSRSSDGYSARCKRCERLSRSK